LEDQAVKGSIELYYGDATKVSQTGYVPYGWQFEDEQVCIEVKRGRSINCFGLLSRTNEFIYKTTRKNITSDFIIELLDALSLKLKTYTVVVLDNAQVHTAKKVKKLLEIWQNRGLFIFYLPPYSPHLNIIERLWKEIKEGWLKPEDYQSADHLFYAVDRICANVGKELRINFSQFM